MIAIEKKKDKRVVALAEREKREENPFHHSKSKYERRIFLHD